MESSAYQARFLSVARMLWDASEGNSAAIPQHYADWLSHEYVDGDCSMVPLLSKFNYVESIEDFEFDEAIELLGKVNPSDWPNIEDVEEVDIEKLLNIYDEDACSMETSDFVEDNLGTAQRVERVIEKVIESVIGEPVEKIRGKSGSFPSAANKFLQEGDGTFSGTFMHKNHKFNFEIAPTEMGWLCTYRMDESTLDGLPPLLDENKAEDDPTKKKYDRSLRNRGWK